MFHWFNPLVWLAARQMLTERERACDDQVLLSGARASDYADDLLELARSLGAPWATSRVTTAMARRSQIAGRLLAVLDPHLERKGAGRRSVVFGAALTLGALLPLASATLAVLPAPAAARMPAAASSSPQPGSSAAALAVTALDLDEVRRELRSRERAFAEALALANADALAQFYTEDAQVALPFFPVTYGRQGVRGVWRHLVDNGARGVDIETWEVYAVGDLVCEVGQAHLRDSSGRRTATGRFMTLRKKEGGSWRMHRDLNLAREGGA